MEQSPKKILILVVEDDVSMVKVLREKLVEQGFLAIEASNGEDGLRLALAEHPDLILLDLLMPKMSGKEMLRKLRQDPWGLTARVIILTNVENVSLVSEEMKDLLSDTCDYLIKTDLSLDELVKKVKIKLGLN